MTKISYRSKEGEHILSIMGHAGFAGCGTDIVCAGISALTYALLQTLCKAEEKGGLNHFSYLVQDGAASIRADPKEAARGSLNAAVETVLTGYRMISDAYPEHVQLEEKKG